MGQRHQLFIIARINGKYRSLCAIHHQWLYGDIALRKCRGLLKIFSNPSNRIGLESELKLAASYQPDFWQKSEHCSHYGGRTIVPFPFIATCLSVGAAFCAESGNVGNVCLEKFLMAYNEGDNNDGITVIDISDLDQPRYCFVDFFGMESDRQVPLMTPLSARVYLEAYNDLTDPKFAELENTIEDLKPWALVTKEALEDTWPGGNWQEPERMDVEENRGGETTSVAAGGTTTTRALRDTAFDLVADAVVDNNGIDAESITEAQKLSGYWPKIKERLYVNADTRNFDLRSIKLLATSVKGDAHIDLSPFEKLDSSHILLLMDHLSEDPSPIRSLNISGLKLLKEDILAILKKAGALTALYLFNDVSMDVEEIAKISSGLDIYQKDLLARPLISKVFKPEDMFTTEELKILEFAKGRRDKLAHAVWIGLEATYLQDEKSYDAEGHLKCTNLTRDNQSLTLSTFYGQDFPLVCRKCPLLDISLSLARLVGGIKTQLEWLSHEDCISSAPNLYRSMALSFALGELDGGIQGPGVGSLSKELYSRNSSHSFFGARLEVGQWAFFIFHPCFFTRRFHGPDKVETVRKTVHDLIPNDTFDPAKIYYALVSPEEQQESYKVADVPRFLEMIGTEDAKILATWWRDQVEKLPFVNYLQIPLVEDLAKAVYRPESEEESQAVARGRNWP